jgi:type I restriction enzyme R subunit
MQASRDAEPDLVVITDRNDLDDQLFGTFRHVPGLAARKTPVQAESRDDLLRALLAGLWRRGVHDDPEVRARAGRDDFPLLSTGATSSSSPTKRTAPSTASGQVLDAKDRPVSSTDSPSTCAMPCRTPLSSASPARPLKRTDKSTHRAVFGDYISVYDIQPRGGRRRHRADLLRKPPGQAGPQPGPRWSRSNADVEEVFEDEEDAALKEAAKTRWAALEKLVGAQPRIEQVAADIVQHFEARNGAVEGKAMIVAMSREICARLYAAIVALRPAWHSDDPAQGAIKVVMTGSAADTALLQPHIYNATTKKLLEKRFKDAADPLKIVIVRDMWLTGFDVPCLHTMYVDKPMRDHNLMQAIARVNRVFHDKEGGLVVDYIGIAAELRSALRTYTESKGKGQPALDAAEALAKLKELMDVARGLLHGFDFGAYRTKAAALLLPAANFVLGLEEGKKRWADAVLAITKAFSLCGTLDEAIVLREEIAFFQAIKAVIAKATESDKKLSEDRQNAVLKQILDNAVVAQGVEDIFKLAGLDRPDIGILSDAFLEEVRQLPQRNFAIELLQKLLNDQVKSRARTNVVLERKFSERLLAALNRYRSRAIESASIRLDVIPPLLQHSAGAALSPVQAVGLA